MASGVEFEEEREVPRVALTRIKPTFTTHMVMKLSLGSVRTQAQANIVMLIMAFLGGFLTFYIFSTFVVSPDPLEGSLQHIYRDGTPAVQRIEP